MMDIDKGRGSQNQNQGSSQEAGMKKNCVCGAGD